MTGTYQVANGTIEVPVVTWIPTRVTEQVGYDTVKTGNEFFTMDITLSRTATGTRLRTPSANGLSTRLITTSIASTGAALTT
ncbi:hypothetical protein HC891_28300 [Candidatus Gracilibacteria bacterium]|nr:hypothetical protein [Candidatus Gracilibacteria bacterium]